MPTRALVPEMARVKQGRLHFLVQALVASGATARADIARYLQLFEYLAGAIGQCMPSSDEIIRARYLFDWLWRAKPQRYHLGGHFRITEVLEAQVGEGPGPVGNCLGLTVLYNSLARQFGLRVAAVQLDRAFKLEIPHVFTVLQVEGRQVDIENVVPDGFDSSTHRDAPGREIWSDRQLVADIYLSQGNVLFEAERWQDAISCYSAALELNPDYEKAALNRSMALDQLGRS